MLMWSSHPCQSPTQEKFSSASKVTHAQLTLVISYQTLRPRKLRPSHLIVVLFSENGTFLNDFLRMMPVYSTPQILQHRRESSVVCVIIKAADFFNYREYKNESFQSHAGDSNSPYRLQCKLFKVDSDNLEVYQDKNIRPFQCCSLICLTT